MKRQTKQIQLESLVSAIKMRFDVEPEIQNNSIKIDASRLSIGELYKLEKYCHNRAAEMEVVKNVTFKITL